MSEMINKILKDNFDDKTDSELNMELSYLQLKRNKNLKSVKLKNEIIEIKLSNEEVIEVLPKDYCSNWNVTMPIAVDKGVSLSFDGIDWEADTLWMGEELSNRSFNNIENHAGKPLRAVVICLIKILKGENK